MIKVTIGSQNFKPQKKPIVAMGVFDGVHRGHREIFRQVVERAKKVRGTSVAYTFAPHPVTVLAPLSSPLLINTVEQRVEQIGSAGIGQVVIERFTKPFAQMTPEQFFQKIVIDRLKASE